MERMQKRVAIARRNKTYGKNGWKMGGTGLEKLSFVSRRWSFAYVSFKEMRPRSLTRTTIAWTQCGTN